jgi:hypothetical protein
MDGLIERDVKYFVENTLGVSGNLSHRILIGGYDKKSDLKHAMMRLGIIRR